MDLTIVLRTCGNSGILLNTTPRISGTDRPTLILKCVKSLIGSINNVTIDLSMKLYVLDDNSSPDFFTKIKDIVEQCRVPFELVNLPEKPEEYAFSYNHSSFEQFRYGCEADGLVYFVEDDYLHSDDAIQSMLMAYQHFRSGSDITPVALYPYDSTHNYEDRNEPCRLFFLPQQMRLWRSTSKSACTMFIHSDEVRRYWPLFEIMAKDYRGDGTGTNEDMSLNRMWNNTVNQSGPICLFSPIPSVAIHVSYSEPIELTQQLNDWRVRYDEINVGEEPTINPWSKVTIA